ncbi:MAG TPA: SPFH domain-containing protein [Flavobacteriales bacterium]|nr:SPFH domain-containing protein [Flavobacteriales bacterium]HPH83390.1 SPFH domain-containing protein [Flavobacteriales bacterium]
MSEKSISPKSGALALVIALALIALGAWSIYAKLFIIAPFAFIAAILVLVGLTIVNPNESVVAVLFGSYAGTLKENGFFWMNPFLVKRKISLRARNNESQPIKVNDKLGNPIMIGIVLVWRVENTFKAAFEVDNYELFVKIQSESAIRKLAGIYPYDSFDDEHKEMSLRSGGDEINHQLERELSERLHMAGISVIEARISNLAYSQEIAGAMLQRQQATAIVAARTRIVEGAVGMVELALEHLSKRQIVELDDERKAAMVSNLLVVLCSDRAVSPVVNTGTLNH